jgi:hypothetical protein
MTCVVFGEGVDLVLKSHLIVGMAVNKDESRAGAIEAVVDADIVVGEESGL